jgi:hypothetical protein
MLDRFQDFYRLQINSFIDAYVNDWRGLQFQIYVDRDRMPLSTAKISLKKLHLWSVSNI